VAVFDSAENSVQLSVVSVEKSPIDGDDWEGFAVLFNGDESFRIPQGSYRAVHDSFGQEEIFITAHGPTEYQTVISRKR
jgi:hypothetical protein